MTRFYILCAVVVALSLAVITCESRADGRECAAGEIHTPGLGCHFPAPFPKVWAEQNTQPWPNDDIRLCEMMGVQGALANPEISPWLAAQHAKRECAKLRKARATPEATI